MPTVRSKVGAVQPHPGNGKRQLPLQGKLGRSSTEERRKGQYLDQSLIRKPYLEVAHFSVEKPAQFCAETNILISDCLGDDRLP